MFALLGQVQFEVIGSPESILSSQRYDYAIHRVVQDRPKLQWLAADLELIRFELMLHRSFTNPAADLAVLLSAAQAHQALPLIFGSGEFRGTFVITELSTLSRQLSANGDPVAIAVRIELLESPLDFASGLAPIAAIFPIATATIPALSAVGANSGNPLVAGGVSALVRTREPASATVPGLNPDDVSAVSIVRKAA